MSGTPRLVYKTESCVKVLTAHRKDLPHFSPLVRAALKVLRLQ